ncbi:MAG: DinB family protein [Gemmatimonadales bacterium]|nr:DinB family protein [Gemmatimonadota bacterium]MBP6444066.1 DinB family protein [Gemmatimonadales bacterium]MBP7620921.1 DinB family protein [Gemmatimonadales bacterium]MBP9897303.1 DinB family protein [Gemmatimonadales bacterium]
MLAPGLVAQLESTRKFFGTTTSIFEEADAGYSPTAEMYTVAGQVAHAADTLDWFVDGALGKGWDMDFEASIARAKTPRTLAEAREMLDRAFSRAISVVGAASDETLLEPIPNDMILDGAPRMAVISAIVDHTAHHRGSLAVYARLLGKVPPMPYA